MAKIVPRKWPFIIIGFWVTLIMGLGLWWLYLIVYLGNRLEQLQSISPEILQSANYVQMAKWEGLTFLVLLFLVSFFLLFFYLQDIKKANWMQAFFASVTHELKTPLASIRLQAEVMKDMIDSHSFSLPTFTDLTGRLLEDTQTLEMELEKILQLSIMERGAKLNPAPINLHDFVQNFIEKKGRDLKFRLHNHHPHSSILVDEFALTLIMRNLLENTIKHRPQSMSDKEVVIEITKGRTGEVVMLYNDQGGSFTGDLQKLGQLFYKHNSSKGQGIGLYLAKKLMEKMNGRLVIQGHPTLHFNLIFSEAQGEASYGTGAK